MRILAIDIGTGTQDVLLWESGVAVENLIQMVMPSPTVHTIKGASATADSPRPVSGLFSAASTDSSRSETPALLSG